MARTWAAIRTLCCFVLRGNFFALKDKGVPFFGGCAGFGCCSVEELEVSLDIFFIKNYLTKHQQEMKGCVEKEAK